MLFIFVDYTIYRGDGTWLETIDISNIYKLWETLEKL